MAPRRHEEARGLRSPLGRVRGRGDHGLPRGRRLGPPPLEVLFACPHGHDEGEDAHSHALRRGILLGGWRRLPLPVPPRERALRHHGIAGIDRRPHAVGAGGREAPAVPPLPRRGGSDPHPRELCRRDLCRRLPRVGLHPSRPHRHDSRHLPVFRGPRADPGLLVQEAQGRCGSRCPRSRRADQLPVAAQREAPRPDGRPRGRGGDSLRHGDCAQRKRFEDHETLLPP